jgi:hypothetical protein
MAVNASSNRVVKETKQMKFIGLIRASVLISLLGASALICAQDPKPQDEPRPEATRPPRDEAKPPSQDDAKPPRLDDVKPPKQDDAKPAKPEDVKPAARQDDAKPPKQAEHPDQASDRAQRADNKRSGGRIPDDKFRANFGRQHTLIINRTTIVEGQPRFQYSGYWFALVDPWPVGWAYSDQCFIDYVDGEYFLFDLLHPGARIAIDVVM